MKTAAPIGILDLAISGLTLLLQLTATGQTPSYTFAHLGVEEGLSQNTVLSICQDRKGFMWFGTKNGLNRYDGHAFRVFMHDPGDPSSIGNNVIHALCEGQDGKLWVGTEEGVYVYDPQLERFSRFTARTPGGNGISKEVRDIRIDAKGRVWFAARFAGVFVYEPWRNRLLSLSQLSRGMGGSLQHPASICFTDSGQAWVGDMGSGLMQLEAAAAVRESKATKSPADRDVVFKVLDAGADVLVGTKNDGLKMWHPSSGTWTPVLSRANGQPVFVRDIARYGKDEVWVGTESGLYIVDINTNRYQHLEENYFDPSSLSDNAVYSLYKDREGGMWVGTYFGGVNYFPRSATHFRKYYPLPGTNSISGKRVREFCEDAQGNIWIGTEDAGLNLFNPRTGQFTHFKTIPSKTSRQPNVLTYHNIHALVQNGNQLWVGTYSRGLDVLDLTTRRVRHYEKTDQPSSLGSNDVFALYKDRSATIWVGTVGGVYRYNPTTDDFSFIKALGSRFIYDMLEDHRGWLWVATRNDGLLRYNPRTQEVKFFRHVDRDRKSLPHVTITRVFEDSQQRLWVASEGGGVGRYEEAEERFSNYTTRNGLPSNVVYSIVEDSRRHLWLSTANGLVELNPVTGSTKVYTKADGLPVNQFNYKSGIKSHDGTLYFGSLQGMVAFRPETFLSHHFTPSVVLTGLQIYHREVAAGDKGSPLKRALGYTESIRLRHDQSSLSLSFAALGYTAPQSIRYAYRMEGYDRAWTYLNTNQKVTYSHLPPGQYVFQVMASSGSGKWNAPETSLRIQITPPFWRSSWAYGAYILLGVFLASGVVLAYHRRMKSRHQRSLERLENEKERAIYDAKIEFFTNVAHEIRTPLTLINGPLEQLLREQLLTPGVRQQLSLMHRNTNRLVELTDQLLHLRKIEQKHVGLTFVRTDLTLLLQETHARFTPVAQQRGLEFTMRLPQEPLHADVDPDALDKLLGNLFSNAIKYATSCAEILAERVGESQSEWMIRVRSDGERIPPSLREKLFEPFFRIEKAAGPGAPSGTGLGLPLARSLAQLHNGQLYLDGADGEMNTFVLVLPINQAQAIALAPQNQKGLVGAASVPRSASGVLTVNRPKLTVLVVEDHSELQQFLVEQLEPHYRVHHSADGLEALAILDRELVDVVVSDVMMPLKTGFELCEAIKTNVQYSHIPVVLLTARNTLEARMKGLETGADAYVEKPFSVQYLLQQIATLLTNRDRIRTFFARSPLVAARSIALSKADEQFLTKVEAVVQAHLAEVDFGVDQLADALNMSQSSLLRKVKGVADLTPTDFIRLIRLKRAAQLLEEGEFRINEICVLVGFNSASYFAKCFQKQFGVLPKEAAKR